MYTLLEPVSQVFKTVLDFLNSFLGNHAWSIILLTLLFRICLLPFDLKQKKSMRLQKEIQPKIDALNKKYANDKDKLNRKMMELYKESHFNPLSGCLPMLLQLPIFIAFFGAIRIVSGEEIYGLYESMKNTGNAVVQNWLWIRNIWQPDSFMAPVIPAFESLKAYASFANVTDYNAVMAGLISQYEGYYNGWFILPLLAGASSFFQTKLTQPPAQSQPKKDSASPFSGRGMQTIFPIISVWFCATSSAIFSLYWLTSNVASIVSHWAMDRFYKRQEEKKKLEGGSTL